MSFSSVDTAEPSPVPKVVEFFSNQAIVDAPIIPVRPCSNQASVEHYCEISCRALLKGRLSLVLAGTVELCSSFRGCLNLLQPSEWLGQTGLSSLAPAGTVEPFSSAHGCRALLQPGYLRALLRSSLSSLAPGAVEPCSGRHSRHLLLCPQMSSLALTKRS